MITSKIIMIITTVQAVLQCTLNEGITDVETFLELNDQDFNRLRFKTKLIKTIQKIQKEFLNDPIIEELDEDDDPLRIPDGTTGKPINNPYRGIVLEQIIDINDIFSKTASGNEIIELLNEQANANDKLLNKINRTLCDFLQSNYGLHPTSFHKNLLAVSLVTSYPVLASTTRDVPQALWFHPHGRGKHRHAGRIHYHMEYMSRKSDKRLINRPRTIQGHVQLPTAAVVPDENIEELILEMQYLCPGPTTKSRAEELWMMTFVDREKYRKKQAFHEYTKLFPVASAFQGLMVTLDFQKMYPDAQDFCMQFLIIQPKILEKYDDFFPNIRNDFLRTLAIIRMKNPSRGVKRSKSETAIKKNPLDGIVELIEMHGSAVGTNTPMLYLKPGENDEGIIVWKECSINVTTNIVNCFRILCEAIHVFNCDVSPENKQFYSFIFAAIMNIGVLSTTGENFFRSIQ